MDLVAMKVVKVEKLNTALRNTQHCRAFKWNCEGDIWTWGPALLGWGLWWCFHFTLRSTDQIKHKETIKVVISNPYIYCSDWKWHALLLTQGQISRQVAYRVSTRQCCNIPSWKQDIMARCFHVSAQAEAVLKNTNKTFVKDGTL